MKLRELETIASAAYGERWKQALADDIGITREMIWRYATGRTEIPDYNIPLIRKACEKAIKKQMATLQKALASLGAAA